MPVTGDLDGKSLQKRVYASQAGASVGSSLPKVLQENKVEKVHVSRKGSINFILSRVNSSTHPHLPTFFSSSTLKEVG